MVRRMINAELFRNVDLGDCDPTTRLLYIGMIVNADDEGRMRAHPKYLKAAIFPFDLLVDAAMVQMREALVKRKMIVLYEVDGIEYLQHPKWEKWQILRKDRVKSSDCPSPRTQAATICQPSDNQNDNSGCLTEPNPTEPNPTKPNDALPPFGSLFEKIWAKYPKRDGKKAAERHFRASVKTAEDWFDIQRALDNYLKCETVRKGFIKNGSTWFNNWQDWTHYTEDTHGTHERKSVYFSDDHKGGAVRHSEHHSGLRKTPPSAGALLDRLGIKPLPLADRGEEPSK